MKRGIKTGNITLNSSLLKFSDEALEEQKHAIRIADEKVALAAQAYDLVRRSEILLYSVCNVNIFFKSGHEMESYFRFFLSLLHPIYSRNFSIIHMKTVFQKKNPWPLSSDRLHVTASCLIPCYSVPLYHGLQCMFKFKSHIMKTNYHVMHKLKNPYASCLLV